MPEVAAEPAVQPQAGGRDGRLGPELASMLAVSRAVARGGPLPALLDRIAAEAATVLDARGAGILLLAAHGRLRLAGSYGLSTSYAELLDGAPTPISLGHGPAGRAVADGRPVVVADTEDDAAFAPWRPIARREGYRSLASVPLPSEIGLLGALNVYRGRPAPWPDHEQALLSFFGEHAASAIRTAQLIDRQHRQVSALSRMVGSLREQTHEHANRIHAIGGLLALGATAEAARFVATLEDSHHIAYGAVSRRLHQPVVAGLVLAEMATARRRGIALELDDSSHLEELGDGLTEPDAVTVIGNLLENAFDAVGDLPPARRRVALAIRKEPDALSIRVRDHGPGVPPARRSEVLRRGVSSKPEHSGVGLALVADAVAAAGGTLQIDAASPGSAFLVTVPLVLRG